MILRGIKELQNGTDVRGIAMNGIIGEKPNFDPNMASKIAYTFATWLKEKTGKETLTISVGHDSRLTAADFDTACCMGLIWAGVHVYDCGMATTPSMFMTIVDPEMQCDGAIMITASHLPFNRNGLKFFTKDGGMEKDVLADILARAEEIETPLNTLGRRQAHPYLQTYSESIVSLIRERTGMTEPLKGTHIVVDAGNGAGGFFVEKVLDVLGADTTGSQFLEPDGLFPNHAPNPEDPEAIASVCEAVVKNNADMGIIFDTDVDRSAIIDETGKPINRNAFIAFMAKMILHNYPGTIIVTDSITSTGLTEYIESLGGTHHRFKRGYKNVINEAIRLNAEGRETHLAMETSGHGAIKENYFLDDGAYLATMALIEYTKLHAEEKKLSEYLVDLKEPIEAVEKRYIIDAEDFKDYGADVLKDFQEFAKQQSGWTVVSPNYEGVRVSCDKEHGDGWCLLRMSLHEPKMPLNIESDSVGGCETIKSVIDKFIENHPELKL